ATGVVAAAEPEREDVRRAIGLRSNLGEGRIRELEKRYVCFRDQVEAAAAAVGVMKLAARLTAEALDRDEQKRGRRQQPRREQAADRIAGRVARTELQERRPAAAVDLCVSRPLHPQPDRGEPR